jgi:hypothetical protein
MITCGKAGFQVGVLVLIYAILILDPWTFDPWFYFIPALFDPASVFVPVSKYEQKYSDQILSEVHISSMKAP